MTLAAFFPHPDITFPTLAAIIAAIVILILIVCARSDLKRFWREYRKLCREGRREPQSEEEAAERMW